MMYSQSVRNELVKTLVNLDDKLLTDLPLLLDSIQTILDLTLPSTSYRTPKVNMTSLERVWEDNSWSGSLCHRISCRSHLTSFVLQSQHFDGNRKSWWCHSE